MYKILLLCVVLLVVSNFGVNIQAQTPMPGYQYTYDDNGNRIERMFTTVMIKKGDSAFINSIISEYVITVKPNPTKGFLELKIENLASDSKVDVSVYNISGQVIIENADVGLNSIIDLYDKPNGVYFLRLRINNEYKDFKILKQN